jgi:hypothetical protein
MKKNDVGFSLGGFGLATDETLFSPKSFAAAAMKLDGPRADLTPPTPLTPLASDQ